MIYSKPFRCKSKTFLLLVWLCLQVFPLYAQQQSQLQVAGEETKVQVWQPPVITELSLDWWQQFEVISAETFQERATQFITVAGDRLQGLQGDDFVSGQNLLSRIKGQVDLLSLALQESGPKPYDPISTKDAYTLGELLDLRAQWRELEGQQNVPELRIDEVERQSALLEKRRDNLLKQYNSTDVNAPARILLGLQRVSARIEYELAIKQIAAQNRKLEELKQQSELLSQQLEFARTHLESGDTDWHAIESQANVAHTNAVETSKKLSTLQHQLLDVLSADVSKPSLELLRKQQLTRTSARQSLLLVQENLFMARANWYRFHAGTLDFDYDIQAAATASSELVTETSNQVEVWTAASQTTLITPLPDTGVNASKNIELAHSVAQETLALIGDIQSASDDLLLVQVILTEDMVDVQRGFKGLQTRLNIFSAEVWRGLLHLLDYNLFHIGDAPVTPGGIITMVLVMVFGFLLSWFLRHLLERLKNRKQFAKSPIVYSLGRVLHYIIIIAAVFAALGTIGLDFTNFALIAGALSVGIGFGLQSIVNNFVSGLILLFEGTLRVGDFIELDTGLRGMVKEINTRATVITTNDSVDVVVPNSDFVSNQLTNWTLRESIARLRIRFGVAYGSDKEEVKSAVLEACAEGDFVLMHTPGREPQVRLVNFGDSSIEFEVLIWVNQTGVRRPGFVRAQFFWALEGQLKKLGIKIPFPQRDIHLRSGFDQ